MTQIFLEIKITWWERSRVIQTIGGCHIRQDPSKLYVTTDGSWYQKIVVPAITDTGKQLAVPIGLYIDASETVTYQQYSFQPLLMFPLLLNTKVCSQKTAYKVLALLPDLEA
jgi:short subunit fatty acids transporter